MFAIRKLDPAAGEKLRGGRVITHTAIITIQLLTATEVETKRKDDNR